MRKTVEEHLDVAEAARRLAMSKSWIRARVREGELVGFLLGNKLVITTESINRLLERRRVSPADLPQLSSHSEKKNT